MEIITGLSLDAGSGLSRAGTKNKDNHTTFSL